MNFKDYLTIARERWIVVFLGVALGLGLGGAVAFVSTPQYAASTKFFVASRDSNDLNQAYQGSLLSEQKIKSYVDLASDRRIREQVSLQLGYEIAAGAISATAKPDTVLLTLTATDPSPRRAQAIANLAANALSDLIAEVEKPEAQGEAAVVARQIQEAQLPIAPISPRQKTALGVGFFLGLLAGMGMALLRHSLDRTVKSPDALAELVDAPVLGATQWDPNIKSRPLIVHDQPRAPMAEAFRQLRTNLDYVDLDHTNKLLCVTSALPHEGKTTTACNLAIALAQAGNRVLLVEADLRRPKAASYMSMENAVGLTTVLTGQVPLDVAIQPWGGGLLDFLGAGALPPNPSELLASVQMANVLAELNLRYDVVVMDAAPTLPVADAVALAAHCHGVLFVSRHGWVRSEQVKAAVENLRRVSVPIFGVVLSMTPRAKAGGGYTYQYGYRYTADRVKQSPHVAVAPVAPAPTTPVAPTPAPGVTAPPVAAWDSWDSRPTVPAPRSTYGGSEVVMIDSSGLGGSNTVG